MDYFEAALLGIIQGLTEFLPVSSSGHLEIAESIFGSESLPEERVTFTIVLHLATALATIFIFRKEIYKIFSQLFQFKKNEELFFSIKIILSMLPAAFVGFFAEDLLTSLFSGKLILIGFMLILTAVLLLFADFKKNTHRPVSFVDSIIIGFAQAVAIIPGISRSGATIASSVILGIEREKAARFSFLMVIPLIFGKIAKDLLSANLQFYLQEPTQLLIGFCTAFVTGLLACKWMIKLVKSSKLFYFSIYCCLVGVAVIIFSFVR